MDATETTVAAVRDAGDDALAVDLETPPGFEAEPGQFVKLTTTVDGESASRFYTISSPDALGTFTFTVGFDPEEAGPFSDYLRELDAGDVVTLSGPFGRNYYEAEPRARRWRPRARCRGHRPPRPRGVRPRSSSARTGRST